MEKKHSHYHKPCGHATVDVYRVLQMFEVKDQGVGHAIKKLLVAGGRGAGKSFEQDIQEAIDTLTRVLAMRKEDIDVTKSRESFADDAVRHLKDSIDFWESRGLLPIDEPKVFTGLFRTVSGDLHSGVCDTTPPNSNKTKNSES